MSPTLRLTIVDPATGSAADRVRVVSTGPFRVGREEDNDWAIDDPARLMSRHHCTFDLRAGVFVIIDTSSNGVFINTAQLPLGRGNSAIVKDGDRFRLGSVILTAKLGDPEGRADPFLAILPGEAGHEPVTVPEPEPDPFPPPRKGGFPTLHLPLDEVTMSLPLPEDDSFSALLPQRASIDADPDFDRPAAVEAESDHVPAQMQAYQPVAPAGLHIPEDWDDETPDYPAPSRKPFSLPDDPLIPAPGASTMPPPVLSAAASGGLPMETQQALVEALCTIVQAVAPDASDIMDGASAEVLERLQQLEPEWASLELASIAARISTAWHERAGAAPQVPGDGKDAS